MADLLDRQWDLDGFLFGPGTGYIAGPPDISADDRRGELSPWPRADGQRWGRGYRGGRSITWDVTVDGTTPEEASQLAAALEMAWDATSVRAQPGAVCTLRYRWAGRTKRVYGRPGKLAPKSTQLDRAGRIDYTAEFITADHLFYGDDVTTLTVPYVPASLGGLVGPQTGGWTATSGGVASGVFTVDGVAPAWLAWTVHGPIVNPVVEVVGQWSAALNVTLAYDQAVTVDPSPWNRRVYRVSDGANFAGAFTALSRPLSQMTVPAGTCQVLLRGTDPTGSSSLSVSTRPVWPNY